MEEKKQPGRAGRRRSEKLVVRYIAALFAAALVLLLVTGVMEWRQHQRFLNESREQLDDLSESVSAVQRVDKLLAENKELAGRNKSLQSELDELRRSCTKAEAERDRQARSLMAMDWFWQIDEAFVRRKFTRCRELLAQLDGAGLTEFLPRESITANGRFSPYDRCMEIREALNG